MSMRSEPRPTTAGRVRVSLVVKDERGFTHIYEELETTPAAVRDAYDLMARLSVPAGLAPVPEPEERSGIDEIFGDLHRGTRSN